jgi:hypothetical protein
MSSSKKKRASKIIWDEDTIALHDLDRGTRQKIDEPDTPFTTYTEEGMSEEVKNDRFSLDGDMVAVGVLEGAKTTPLVRGLSDEMMMDGGGHGGVQVKSKRGAKDEWGEG